MFWNRKKFVERWNMAICSSTEAAKIQEYLNEGFEPFGVITKPVPIKEETITTPGKPNQAYKLIEIIYFKQRINALMLPVEPVKEEEREEKL